MTWSFRKWRCKRKTPVSLMSFCLNSVYALSWDGLFGIVPAHSGWLGSKRIQKSPSQKHLSYFFALIVLLYACPAACNTIWALQIKLGTVIFLQQKKLDWEVGYVWICFLTSMLSKKRTWLEEVVPFESSQVPKIATFLCDSPLDRNGCFTCYINCYSSTEMMNDISIDKVSNTNRVI